MATLPTKVWTRLIGAGGNDNALAITIGLDGCIYLCGGTNGSLDGQVNNGGYDAFVTKYNPDGTKVWTRLLCTINDETAFALTVGTDGSIYVCGGTFGPLDGQANNGGKDAFVAKFNPDGTKVWTRLLGTSGKEVGYSLTTGLDGAVYVSGDTEGALEGQTNNGAHDVFVTKFNPDGTKVWTRLLGTGSDEGVKALTTGSDGFIYVSGYTGGSLDGQTSNGGNDAFVTKYNPDGTKVWTRLLGSSSDDVADALTTGLDGSIYVSGYTGGLIDGQSNSGIWDAFVSKYNPDGTKVWTRTLGTSSYDEATALTTGLDGFIFVTGYTGGSLDGQASNGGYDAFLTQYNPDGTKVWTRLLGNSSDEFAYAIAKGLDGTIYVSGIADGSLDGQINGGSFDGFTVKYQVLAAAPTFSISATSPSINEGNTATLTLKTSGLASGTAVTYTLSGISAADITGGQLTGIAVINSIGTATISVPIAADVLNDSGEILTITVQGATASLLINDTSFSPATFSLVTETLAVNEGSTAIVTLSTTNVSAGTSVPYTLSGNRITTSDISSGQLNGTAIVGVTGKATIAIPIAADQTTEGPETITLTAQGVSASIVINDTSLTPAIFVVDTGFSVTQSNQTIYGGADTAVIWINKGAYSKVYAYNSATSQTTIQPNGQLVDFIGDTFVYGNTQANNTRLTLSFLGNKSPVTLDARNFHTTGIVTTSAGANFSTDHVAQLFYESGCADTIFSSGSYESFSGYRDNSNSGNNTNGAGLTIVFPKNSSSYSISYNQTSRNDPSGAIYIQDQSIPIFGNGWADSRVFLRGAKALVFTDRTITIESNGQPSSTAASYVISPINDGVGEGGIATFKLTTANVAAGSTVDYALSGTGITPSDIVGGQLNGSVVLDSSGTATISLPIASDGIAEGSETLVVTVAGRSASVLITDASTVLVPTYALSAANSSVNEGASVIFTLTTNNVAGGTALTYTLSGTGITANDIFGGALTGTAVIDSTGRAIISVPISSDLNTEGAETLTITVQGATTSVLVNDTSVASVTPTYFLTTASASVNEGSVATFTLTTTNVPGGTSIPYTLAGAGITSGDISGGQLSGSVVVDGSGKATVSIPIASDGISEGGETLLVTAGGKTASILINDAGIAKNGTSGPDSLVGSVGSDTIDGGGGVDTVYYSSNQSAYTLTRGAAWTISSLSEGADSLLNMERLHFADLSVALDLGSTQSAGQAAVLLGAVLPGKLALDASKQALMGAVIGLIDQGYSLTVLAGALLRLDIWTILTGSNTNQAIANYLLTNVNGVAPDATSLANGVNALNTEPVQGTWLAALAGGSAGQSHIGLSALAQTGLAFIAPEAITPSVQSINEGDTINFALTTNLPQGTSLPYTLSGTGLTGADITGGALSGTVTVNAYGQANVPVGIVADSLTEGAETLVFTSRGLSASVVINDTSVLAIPTYAITAGVANVNEGGTVTFTVSTTNVAAGTVIPYTLSGTGINGLDIAGGQLSGSAVITQSGSAVITVTVASDVTTEGPETLIATVAGKTAQIVINDTSMAAATYRILLSALTVFGGDTLVVTLKTTNLTAGTRVPYSLTVPVLDIVGGTLSGDFIVDASGSASINIATTLHQTTDNLIINVVDQQQTVILVGVKGG
jgi:hypothetical protein